jgi:NTP pyrophosphatase (non-canonical NTP hydrolase)
MSKTVQHERPIGLLQRQVDDWIHTVGVRYFDPLTNMAVLAEEVGEVARVMARSYGEQSSKRKDKGNLGEELSDVLFVVLCLANQTGTDLQAAFDKKFAQRTKRDRKRHDGNKKLR